MKIFLTGGTGFVGSHLLNALGASTHEVTAILGNTGTPCIQIEKEPFWLEKKMDMLDKADFSGVDVFVHLASVGVSPRTANWHDLFYWNVLVMLDLLEKAHAAGVKHFVLAGSFAEYGLSADNYDFIPVNAPLLPTSPYASSKAAGFIAANTFAIRMQIKLSYLRIFSAYGEGQCMDNFWPSLREAALSGKDFLMTPGRQIRDFVPITDVVRHIMRAIDNSSSVICGKPFIANIGSGNPMPLLDFARKCWAEWNAEGRIIPGAKPYRPNEPMRFVPHIMDNS